MKSLRRSAVAISAAVSGALIFTPVAAEAAVAPRAASATSGLYGSADPTYDGVFRQSLAVLALTGGNVKPAPAAVAWLVNQQCGDGAFMGYRADLAKACFAYDANSWSGQDTNATAMAAIALKSAGKGADAAQAITWLMSKQGADGGWAMLPGAGGTSDANSTGLVLSAIAAVPPADKTKAAAAAAKANRFLTGLQMRCAAPSAQRGGIAFDVASKGAGPNTSATAQASVGLVGVFSKPIAVPTIRYAGKVVPLKRVGNRLQATVGGRTYSASAAATRIKVRGTYFRITKRVIPPAPITASKLGFSCPAGPGTSTKLTTLGYLNRQLQANGGALPDAYTPGQKDLSSTAFALMSLGAAKVQTPAVAQSLTTLGKGASAWVKNKGADDPARLAVVALAAQANGKNSKVFGNVRLLERIANTRRA